MTIHNSALSKHCYEKVMFLSKVIIRRFAMIEAIRNIGEYALKKMEKSVDEPLEILLDNPANRNTKNILFILLNRENEEFNYCGIEIEEYSKEKLKKYLYRKGGSSGSNMTPAAKIAGNVEKTFKNRILKWFDKNYSYTSNYLVEVGDCIKNSKQLILQNLKEKYSKNNNIISLKINNQYLGDIEIFKDILIEQAKKDFYFTKSFSKGNRISKSKDQFCSVCNKRQKEVYGFVNTFNFYTVDKPGFVSGGFQQKGAWKNYPVCLNCALTLEKGKKYLEENLNFNFYGFRYLLIPKFISGIDKETEKEVFKIMKQQKDPKFRKTEINRLTNAEDEVLELMSKQENYLNMNFMFYAASNAEFKILLYVENILPSRLRNLFDIKKDVDNFEIFKGCMVPISEDKKKTGDKSLELNFGVLRDFFYDFDNKRWISRKYFLDIVNKIFVNKPINYDFLLDFIMRKIREDFINGYSTKTNTLKGFMLLNYLKKLNLLEYKREVLIKMERLNLFKEIGGEMKEKTEAFFDKFSDFFNSDAKKAIFLEGVLAQFLLNIQSQERKATPFRAKLKGLKLNEKEIIGLLPKIQNKLEEYGKNYYRDLESIISYYFASSGNGWNISNDEISFYFVLGMNLSDLFKKEKNNGGKENE